MQSIAIVRRYVSYPGNQYSQCAVFYVLKLHEHGFTVLKFHESGRFFTSFADAEVAAKYRAISLRRPYIGLLSEREAKALLIAGKKFQFSLF